MKKNLYDKLGVDKNSSKEDIKKAYRKKAKDNHPDKGGDEQEMTEITIAYSILSSDTKRKRYDETGNTNPENPFQTRFIAYCNQMFIAIIDSKKDVRTVNLISEFKERTLLLINEMYKNKTIHENKNSKLSEVLKRTISSSGNVINSVLINEIENHNQEINKLNDEVDFLNNVVKVLDNYTYSFEEAEPQQFTTKNAIKWQTF
jgi:curved DNA-binding protein CbpA